MRVPRSTSAWIGTVARSGVVAILGAAAVTGPLLQGSTPAAGQSRDSFGRGTSFDRPPLGKSGVSDERRVASEADFLLIAAQSDIARGDAREARRKLDALIAQFPAEPAAVDAQRLLQRLPGVAPASTAVDRTPAEGSGSGSERGQLPPAGADRAAAIDGRRLKVLVDDFRATIGDRVFFGEASADIGAKSRVCWRPRPNG